jgi:ATP-dependent DNA helicase DinG
VKDARPGEDRQPSSIIEKTQESNPQSYLREVFGTGGKLSEVLPGYKPRAGQVRLTRAVDDAMRVMHSVLLLDGPCGVGKSLAYLVPSIHHALRTGQRLVIATATIQLQDQLLEKDLPLLQRALGWKFSFTGLKGRGNYACLEAIEDLPADLGPPGPRRDSLKRLLRWIDDPACDGDKSHAPAVTDDRTWSKISVSPEECKKPGCPSQSHCFYERRRASLDQANVIVTNMHLLAAHLRHGRVLPEFGLLVIDEAHELADATRGFQSSRIYPGLIERVAAWCATSEDASYESPDLANVLRSASEEFFADAGSRVDAQRARSNDRSRSSFVALDPDDPPAGTRQFADAALDAARFSRRIVDRWDASEAKEMGEPAPHEVRDARVVERKASRLAGHLLELLDRKDSNLTHWSEVDKQDRVAVVHAPVDIAPVLARTLFATGTSIVLASATLATSGSSFAFARRTTGAPSSAKELAVPSPFNFSEQCLLVTPDMPDPKHAEAAWREAVYARMGDVIEACDGRTLALFTSEPMMKETAIRLRQRLGDHYPFLVQNEDSPASLTARFRAETRTSLLGLKTFMTGLDVPGESLTTVVLDRLPIAPQSDPIENAIRTRLGENRYFTEHAVPRAVVTFRQAIGRAIRTTHDVGAIVILDPRINTQNYGKAFRDALPSMPVARSIDEIPAFLAEAHATIARRGSRS